MLRKTAVRLKGDRAKVTAQWVKCLPPKRESLRVISRIHVNRQTLWHTLVIPELGRQRQEDLSLTNQATWSNLTYLASSRRVRDAVSKKKKNKTNKVDSA